MIMDAIAHQFFLAVDGGRKLALILGDFFKNIHLLFRIDKLLAELMINNRMVEFKN